MREIKFRGKRLNGRLKFNKSITRLENGSVRLGGYAVIPETVGQYTGLTDKNGVEIYEGDILIDVEFDENNNDISGKFPVVYDSSKCQFAIDNSFKKDGSSLVNFIEYFGVENLKIVGNIHDNPELL